MELSRRRFFGVVAGAVGGAIVGTIHPAQAKAETSPIASPATDFPQEGYEIANVRWFNRVRGIGFLTGQSSGRKIFINARLFADAGIEKVRPGSQVWVHWKIKGPKGPMAQEIRQALL